MTPTCKKQMTKLKTVPLLFLLLIPLPAFAQLPLKERSPKEHSSNTPKKPITKSPLQNAPISTNSIGMKFRPLKAGTFVMGNGDGMFFAHKVTLTRSFEMGVYEVSCEQYQKVMGEVPLKEELEPELAAIMPIHRVSWNDAVEFCDKLSRSPKEKVAGYSYRLPTEAEWEYACRAGSTTRFCFGDDESELIKYGWYRSGTDSGFRGPVRIGALKPNAWGLHDMHGGVWEWCQDYYEKYPRQPVTDPAGPMNGEMRITRGGGWISRPYYLRSYMRYKTQPSEKSTWQGFRVVRERTGKKAD